MVLLRNLRKKPRTNARGTMFIRSLRAMSKQSEGHENLTQNSDLKILWKPYLSILKYLGIVYCPSNLSHNLWMDPWVLYCFLILVYSWIILIFWSQVNKLTNFEFYSNDVAYVLNLSSSLAEVVCLTSLLTASLSRRGFHNLFVVWSQFELERSRMKNFTNRLQKMCWGISIIFLVLSIIQVAAYTKSISRSHFKGPHFSTKDIILICRAFGVFISVHMIGLLVLMSFTLWMLFSEVNDSLVSADDDTQKNLTKFNEQFQLATRIVSASNVIFSFVLGPYCLSYIFQMIFNTYLLLYDNSSMYIYNIYWMLESIILLHFIAIPPILVNYQAHKSYDNLCNTRMQQLSLSCQMMIVALQNRLSTSSIGLSMFGVQVLSKKILPSILSAYVTYIFLIIQFKPQGLDKELMLYEY